MGESNSNLYDSDSSLLARVAWLYYMHGLTQEQIGRKLDFSRTKVTRLLARARESGVVEINLNPNFRACLEIEWQLRNALPLRDVIVVPTSEKVEDTRSGIGRACAHYLQRTLSDGDVLGCAWGRSLYYVGRYLHARNLQRLTVVQLMGGLKPSARINPQEILEMIAAKLNTSGVWLNAPAIVSSATVRNALIGDESVREVIRQWNNCTKAMVGVGDLSDNASLVASKALTAKEIKQLRSKGAVGDINARYFDQKGAPVPHELNERIISLPLADLKKIPVRIAVTAGIEKAQPIIGAIMGKYINILITDERTAEVVLRLLEEM